MPRRKRVIVGMSGGVDSSVAAWLLKQQGFDVVGVFMKNWEDDDTDDYCTSREDLVDAAAVADVLGIDLEAVNFAAEYRSRVFAQFLREYEAGRTPNPDVLCNSEIKFRAFLDHALALGADAVATGHYARVRPTTEGNARVELLKALDKAKDQSYFLHRLTQAQLAPVMFPLGPMNKSDVRAIARREGIPTWAKKDSTGICFIGERPFREFLARYLPRLPGPIVTPEGRHVGTHTGIAYYTLGQRQGLGVEVIDMHWIAGRAPPLATRLAAKTRYRMADATCEIEPSRDGVIRVVFTAPQWAPTPGQYLVLYDGDVCLGGGVIESSCDDTGTTGHSADSGATCHSEDSDLPSEEPAVRM